MSETHVIVLNKRGGQEHYICCYDQETCDQAIAMLGRWVLNPELSFTRTDCRLMINEMAEMLGDPYSSGLVFLHYG